MATYTASNGVVFQVNIPDTYSGSVMAKGAYTVSGNTVTAIPAPMINVVDINLNATYNGVTISSFSDLIKKVIDLELANQSS